MDLLLLMMSRTLPRKDFTADLQGLMSSFPLYLRMFLPRKSKPSPMWVITVFSSDSCNPLSVRNSLTMGSTFSRRNSGDSPVIIKSSAYRTKFILLQCVFPLTFLRVGSLSWSKRSRPSRVIFISVGEIVPPCGVPSSVGNNFCVSTYPHFSHFSRICVSIGMFSNSHW